MSCGGVYGIFAARRESGGRFLLVSSLIAMMLRGRSRRKNPKHKFKLYITLIEWSQGMQTNNEATNLHTSTRRKKNEMEMRWKLKHKTQKI